jgi:hypothetical protein
MPPNTEFGPFTMVTTLLIEVVPLAFGKVWKVGQKRE